MAHHKSAIKRIRRNNSANVRNSEYLTAVRTAVKKFRLAASSAAAGTIDKSAVGPLFLRAQSLLAKAATKGLLHRNNASRKVGRLASLLTKTLDGTLAAPVAAAVRKPKKEKVAPQKKEVVAKPKAAPAAAKKPAPKKK